MWFLELRLGMMLRARDLPSLWLLVSVTLSLTMITLVPKRLSTSCELYHPGLDISSTTQLITRMIIIWCHNVHISHSLPWEQYSCPSEIQARYQPKMSLDPPTQAASTGQLTPQSIPVPHLHAKPHQVILVGGLAHHCSSQLLLSNAGSDTDYEVTWQLRLKPPNMFICQPLKGPKHLSASLNI